MMTIRLALLSYWHVHAKDYEREARENPLTEIVAVWDENPDRGAAKAAAIGARFVPDLETVLANPDIDGVIVTTATAEHHRVMTAAANAGKHIFTEKVIASTEKEARDILDAVETAGITMTVCLPRLSNGYTQAIKAMVDRGDIGQVHYLRMRVGHNGALRTVDNPEGWLPPQFFNKDEAQGGALIDLGAHPLYLCRHILGMPDSIGATYGYVTGRAVDDHAVVTFAYTDGAIAVAEVGFLDSPGTWELELHGERGMLRVAQPEIKLQIRRPGTGREQSRWEPVPDVPADLPSPFDQWVNHVQGGTKNPDNLALAFDLTRLAQACEVSAASGERVRFE